MAEECICAIVLRFPNQGDSDALGMCAVMAKSNKVEGAALAKIRTS